MKNRMKNDLEKIILTENEILNKVQEIADKINHDYKDREPVIISILRGATLFSADLIKNIELKLELDFMAVSSYGDSTESSGVVKIKKDIDTDISNRDVILVEDIIDTGLTLKYISEYLKKHNPKSIAICSLLDKPKAHKIDIKIDYVGFEVGNEFVVGYGLDFAQHYRNLPYIGILKKEIYS